ncbi:uncharacterized protein LOC143217833 [Lasioglossum baleicum]|uniref:uncharacterized protein LOC143217833 n=1 Tax=Lasioglossum baleicum TaxID=434251 RepID=UPI003FCC51E8
MSSESDSSAKSTADSETKKIKVSWVYELKKEELIDYLGKNQVPFSPLATVDELRKLLVKSLKRGTRINERTREGSSSSEMEESRGREWEFDVNKDDWEDYTERMDMYFVARDITDAKKQTATLLTKVGARTYKLIRNLCSPAKPSTKSYTELVKLISDHLCPKPSEAMERCNFHEAKQTSTETVADFVARLKALALHCNFKDLNTTLRDQLICGLHDHDAKALLFKKNELSFDQAYKIAISHESAEKNATHTDKMKQRQSNSEVNALKVMGSSRGSRSRYPPRREEKSRTFHPNKQRGGDERKFQKEDNRGETKCYCCGKPNHFARECVHRFKSCNKCQRRGHLDVVCRSSDNTKRHMHWHEVTDGDDEMEPEDFLLMEVTEKYDSGINFTDSEKAAAEPMYLDVSVGGRNLKMQVDSGAYVSVISKNNSENLFPNVKLSSTDMVLKAYGNVPLRKSRIQRMGNFKLTVNPWLKKIKYQLPLINEVLADLGGGEQFSKIDLTHAYMQIPVDVSSRDILTIITHIGLFRYTKLAEGVSAGPEEFQRIMEEALRGIKNIKIYLDNIFCTGETFGGHLTTLYEVFERLESKGFKVNINKCKFFKDEIDILGFTIDKNGIRKSIKKVRAMIDAPTQKNSKQLLSLLGLIIYYDRFLPNRAERLAPLYNATKNEKFVWSKECQEAFNWLKNELIEPRVLAHYDPKVKLMLACDASSYGLSAILSHMYSDSTEKPLAYASKIIPENERHRAPMDKEAGAIIFGLKKFHNYVFGHELLLRTDHKPLIYIFGPKQEIPLTVASRLQRWAYFVSKFNYKIEYISSAQNGNCDALSRLPVEDNTQVFDSEFTCLNYISEGLPVLNFVTVQSETKKDKILINVIKYIMNGWPNEKQLSDKEKCYWRKRNKLSMDKGCILWGYRVVVLQLLQAKVLQELHASHFGIVKMKMLARSYV